MQNRGPVENHIANNFDLKLFNIGYKQSAIVPKDLAHIIMDYAGPIDEIKAKASKTSQLFYWMVYSVPSLIMLTRCNIRSASENGKYLLCAIITGCTSPLFCGEHPRVYLKDNPGVYYNNSGSFYIDPCGPCRLACCVGAGSVAIPATFFYEKGKQKYDNYQSKKLLADCNIAPMQQLMR